MRFLHLLLAAAFLTLLACGKDKPQQADVEGGLRKTFPVLDRVLTENMMRDIKIGFMASPGVTPKTVAELEQIHGNPKITKAINDELLVVVLGVNPEKQPANAILAYSTKPDAVGEHVVLTCGGNILPMDEKTFAAAPKAQAR